MKKTFLLGQMSVQEMEDLDSNRKQYKNVFEITKNYKNSFANIKIRQYKDEFFYGIYYVFKATGLYNSCGSAALRKWGTFTSLAECKKAAIQEIKKAAKTAKEKIILSKFNLQDILNEK